MRCPKCGFLDSKVVDTRISVDGVAIKRRRICFSCAHKFCTVERVEVDFPDVIKRNGSIMEFDCDKIKKSLRKAMDKEQASDEVINQLMSKILSQITNFHNEKIESKVIGNIILEELKRKYPVAYIRFASVYKNFKSADEIASECRSIEPNVQN